MSLTDVIEAEEFIYLSVLQPTVMGREDVLAYLLEAFNLSIFTNSQRLRHTEHQFKNR